MSQLTFPRLLDAQQLLKRDRHSALAEMNEVFRGGRLPETALDGRTHGQMIAVDIAPGITPVADALLTNHMPWCGKTFNAAEATGNNLLYTSFLPVARVLFPGYRGYVPEGGGRMTAFPFRTYAGTGLKDPDRQVLKIDYDTPANPFLMRRILDELVQVNDNFYFGKAYFKLSSKSAHLLFYFALQRA
ncbi:MAG TPA: hypothetical protein VNT81_16015 [Vicinamibacterales bacterium]|nr:hypothetical protein [Vicinamibacterales bacterium]